MSRSPDHSPLSGYRIVDFTANMSGPFGTMILGDQGADVVKVEPPRGDALRAIGTSRSGISAYFANLNRNKRSVALDLTTAAGHDLAARLIRTADVVVQNFRPAVAERLGLTARHLRAERPELIHASVTGFGTRGPYAGRPVYDHVIQAASGMAALQSDQQRQPTLIRHGIVDKVTGQVLAQAITAALLQRARTDVGCDIDVCMLDAAIAFLWPDGMMNHTIVEPDATLPSIANTFRLAPTQDGHVALAILTSTQWAGAMAALGFSPPPPTESEQSSEGHMRYLGSVMKELRRRMLHLPTDQVVAAMAAQGVPCSSVVHLDALAEHPQVVANETIAVVDHPRLGALRQPMPVVDFGFAPSQWRPAPALGEHTVEICREIGLASAQIEDLRSQGVVVIGTPLAECDAGTAAS